MSDRQPVEPRVTRAQVINLLIEARDLGRAEARESVVDTEAWHNLLMKMGDWDELPLAREEHR